MPCTVRDYVFLDLSKNDGDKVAKGEVIGLIEVMKSFHEVKSDVAGSNIRFEADNEEPIMAGAILAQVD
jgi:biotin carboxyl carrier protein